MNMIIAEVFGLSFEAHRSLRSSAAEGAVLYDSRTVLFKMIWNFLNS